jgi:hypothetical protein
MMSSLLHYVILMFYDSKESFPDFFPNTLLTISAVFVLFFLLTKIRVHNITSKAALCCGSEAWFINKRDAQKPEAAQVRFLRPLLDLTRLDRQRNSDILNRLKVDNILEDIISYQKNWIDHLKRMDRSHIPKLAFQYQPRGRRDIERPRRRWRDQEQLEP